MILFESYADFCLSGADPDLFTEFAKFLKGTKGYNLYFFGLFYPEDNDTVNANSNVRAFCQEQFLLLFGGRFDKVCLTTGMPSEVRNISRMAPKYDRFSMKYRDEYYRMLMPCGGAQSEEIDPDDQSIV